MRQTVARRARVTETVEIHVPPGEVFAHLDDIRNVGKHMQGSAGPLLGGRLRLEVVSKEPTGVGATYRWSGRILGLAIELTEVVTEWVPGHSKRWRTTGEVRLIIMGGYELGFLLTPSSAGTVVTLDLEYDLPQGWLGRLLGRLLAGWYARWCLRSILRGAHATLEPRGRS